MYTSLFFSFWKNSKLASKKVGVTEWKILTSEIFYFGCEGGDESGELKLEKIMPIKSIVDYFLTDTVLLAPR